MAQAELMLRLIKDGKIVGYEYRHPQIYIINGIRETRGIEIYHCQEINKEPHFSVSDGNEYDYDSLELGIKVGDDWWFEGDIIYDPMHCKKHILLYDGLQWLEFCKDNYDTPIEVWAWLWLRKDRMKHIGNIHDNPELLEGK